MASSSSSCRKFISKSSLSSIISAIRSSKAPKSPSTPTRSATASHILLPSKPPTSSRFSFSRLTHSYGYTYISITLCMYYRVCFKFINSLILCVRRAPCELGCVQSLLPLHSAAAASWMTSCLSTTSRNFRALSQGTLCCTSPGL